jgi:23S rRNA pseudouridine1911/1915/1917 synthase
VKTINSIVGENEGSIRLDRYISENLTILTRSQLKARLVSVHVNGKDAKLSKKVSSGDRLEITYSEPVLPDVKPEKIKLDIIYEDKNVIVINKPQGMVVHPGSGISSGTLVNGLLYYIDDLKRTFNEEIRPGIVHRLDKDTSGVIITAKNPHTHEFLSNQFRKRKTKKIYLSVIKGIPQYSKHVIESLIIRDPRNRKRFRVSSDRGKKAVTAYEIIRSYNNYSFMKMMPATGRTHQLRVHACTIGCPILGDPMYSRPDSKFPEITLMLHAFKLFITIPGEDKPHLFRAPLPNRFISFFKAQKIS